jgi:hypothetical protein
MTIRHKEQTLYYEVMQFKPNVLNAKKVIPAKNITQVNGGILTVNLYRITEDYFTFQNSTNASICDFNVINALMMSSGSSSGNSNSSTSGSNSSLGNN